MVINSSSLSLSVRALRIKVTLGITAEERAYPQVVLVSVKCWYFPETITPLKSDDLSSAIDYRALSERVSVFAQAKQWNLLEKFIIDCADDLMAHFPKISAVKIKAEKNVLVVGQGVEAVYFGRRG